MRNQLTDAATILERISGSLGPELEKAMLCRRARRELAQPRAAVPPVHERDLAHD